MAEDEKRDPASRLAMLLLCHRAGLDQTGLARVSRTAPSQISLYWRGERPVPRRVLERIVESTDFPKHLLGPLLWHLRAFVAASRGHSRPPRVLATGIAAELTAVLRLAEDLILEPLDRVAVRRAPSPLDREEAAALWEQLRTLSASERLLVVEEAAEYQSWALCERVAAESREVAYKRPREALELAHLALRIAELEEAPTGSRLQGWALFHVANGHRACQDPPAATAAFSRAQELWIKGSPGNPDLLNEAVPLWIEAALRKDEREFPEALRRIEEALAREDGDLRARMLLTKSSILQALGDPVGSAAARAEAAPLIDAGKEPRLALALQGKLLVDLCQVGRFDQAAAGLPDVQQLADSLGEVLDLQRVAWLTGKVAAGLGHHAEAEAAFRQAREAFQESELAYDYALVSLDLSVVLLLDGRPAEVRQIAEEMLSIFSALRVNREAMVALQIFCDAARGETATAALTLRVVDFLERSQHDPELRFENRAEG